MIYWLISGLLAFLQSLFVGLRVDKHTLWAWGATLTPAWIWYALTFTAAVVVMTKALNFEDEHERKDYHTSAVIGGLLCAALFASTVLLAVNLTTQADFDAEYGALCCTDGLVEGTDVQCPPELPHRYSVALLPLTIAAFAIIPLAVLDKCRRDHEDSDGTFKNV